MGKKDHRFQYLRRKDILSTILADVPALDDVLPLFALCMAGDRMVAPLSLCLYSHWPANESVSSRVKLRKEVRPSRSAPGIACRVRATCYGRPFHPSKAANLMHMKNG